MLGISAYSLISRVDDEGVHNYIPTQTIAAIPAYGIA